MNLNLHHSLAIREAIAPSTPTGITLSIRPDEVARLYAALDLVAPQTNPRTARLLQAGVKRMARKVIEEAGEVALEASRRHVGATVRESADLLYHLVVLWRACGISPDDVWAEMRRRADLFGLAEKLPKDASDSQTSSLASSLPLTTLSNL